MKMSYKGELQQTAINYSSDTDFKDFAKISKKYNTENYSFLVKNTTLPSYNHLHFRKHLLKKKLFKIEYIVNYDD